MYRLRTGQKYPVLILAGPQGAGKSKLADHVSQEPDSPFQLISWNTTRPVLTDWDRRRFARVTTEEISRQRTKNTLVFECQMPSGLFALLGPDILAATQAKVGLLSAPSLAAKAVRDAGFQAYVMYVAPVGKKRWLLSSPGTVPDVILDNPAAAGLLLDEYYNNSFEPGGFERAVNHLKEVGHRLKGTT